MSIDRPNYWQKAGDTQRARGNIKSAKSCYQRAAEQYLHYNQLIEAKNSFLSLASLFSNDDERLKCTLRFSIAEALYNEGLKFQHQGSLNEAKKWFGSLIDLKEDRFAHIAYEGLGRTLLMAGRFKDGIDALTHYYDKIHQINKEKGQGGLSISQLDGIKRGIPTILFVAQLKSASEYITDILRQAFQIHAYYNLSTETYPEDFLIPSALSLPKKGGAIIRTHASANNHNISLLKKYGINKLVVHIRDPRQATISWLWYVIKRSNNYIESARLLYRPSLPHNLLTIPLEKQLKWALDNYYPSAVKWIIDWVNINEEKHHDLQLKYTTFEDFNQNPIDFFQNIMQFYQIHSNRIEKIIKDNPKEKMFNFRKGLSDEWKKIFNSEQLDYMWNLIPEHIARRFSWHKK